MNPVEQTRSGERGNCYAACIASIFECSIDDVFDAFVEIDKGDDGKHWWTLTQEWAHERGYRAEFAWAKDLDAPPAGYSIIGGPSPRGTKGGHSCVALDGQLVHDPHPDKTGILEIEDYIWFTELQREAEDDTTD